jgi:hypothetical protein
VYPSVVRGQIAAGGGDSYELRAVRSSELDFGADWVTFASMADQDEREPVVSGTGLVAQDVCRSAIRSDDGIDAAVVHCKFVYRLNTGLPRLSAEKQRENIYKFSAVVYKLTAVSTG